ncbi:MAG: hypothetical protein AAFU83_04875, partial [Bacteroidota bacterium]
MTGIPSDHSIDTILRPGRRENHTTPPSAQDLQRLRLGRTAQYVNELVQSLSVMHEEVAAMQGERRAAERSKRTSPRAKLMKFYPGNYVLHSRRGQASGGREKLQHVWTGPHRVVEEIHPCLYVLEKVLDGTRFQSHVSYLRLYDDGELQLTHDLRNVIDRK